MNMNILRKGKDKIISGVCSGFANYLNIDTTLVRLLFTFFGFCSCGYAVIFYIICAALMPDNE